jgi:hypothetical protein
MDICSPAYFAFFAIRTKVRSSSDQSAGKLRRVRLKSVPLNVLSPATEAVMSNADPCYFACRAEEERRRAEASADPAAREAHLKLAYEYELRANIESVMDGPANDE